MHMNNSRGLFEFSFVVFLLFCEQRGQGELESHIIPMSTAGIIHVTVQNQADQQAKM